MADKKMSFEQALKRLEEIVNSLDSGSAELDKSLELFEEGVKLVKICQKSLDEAEKKLTLIKEEKEGTFSEVPFEPKAD